MLISLGLPERVGAQDMEPRRWSHLPIGQNIAGVGYLYTEANIFFSPILKITNGTSRINSLGISAIHTFNLAGLLTAADPVGLIESAHLRPHRQQAVGHTTLQQDKQQWSGE